MPFQIPRRALQLGAVVGLSALMTGCNGAGTTPTSPGVGVVNTNVYALGQSITFPKFPPAVGNGSFDISFIDPAVSRYYLADRSTNGIDVVNTVSLAYLGTAAAGKFTGITPGVGSAPSTSSGPNGIVSIGGGIVFAGDGDSSMKIVDTNSGALLGTVFPVNPYVGPNLPAICGGSGAPTTGAANQRMDEMAYDPTDGLVLGILDASCPPFGAFFKSTAPYNIVGYVTFPTATGGAEQPVWDPTQKQFLMALPSTVANPGGEVDLISPTTFAVTKTFAEPGTCNGNGLALGKNETLFIGCSATGEIVTINAATGATINTIAGLGGCDEAYYNPTADRFYAACSNNASGPVIVVADGTGKLITSVAASAGAHSIAVDPALDHIFLPTRTAGIGIYTH
jgi:hypothetical protein